MESMKAVRAAVPVELLIDGVEEHAGTTVLMAPQGVLIEGIALEDEAEHEAVFYLDNRQRFTGQARQVRKSLISITVSERSRPRLEAVVEELKAHGLEILNRPTQAPLTARRYTVNAEANCAVLADGSEVPCRVLDVSLTGLGVAMDPLLNIGDTVRIGKVTAQVVRRTDVGYGLQILRDTSANGVHQPSQMEHAQRCA